MEQVEFKVKGSAERPYELIFIKDGDSLTALCNCPAGEFGNVCKHRTSILDGKTKGIVSDNESDVPKIVQWLAGTDVESALIELRAAEKSRESLPAAKRKLARAMNS